MKNLVKSNVIKYIDLLHEDIEKIIKNSNIDGMSKLYESSRHHFNKKGKMLRPLIMCVVNEDLNGNFENIRKFALSLELIHNYSLIHDDLPSMDDDDYRREQLTVHKKYGEDSAILTGDFLLTKAFEIVTSGNVNNNTLKAINSLAYNANENGMIGGQFLDLNLEYLDSKDSILRMYKLKTSALFVSAFKIPGIINNLTEKENALLEGLGRKFGIYFQVKDDISDIEEDQKVGKITLLKFMSNEEIQHLLSTLKNQIDEDLDRLNLIETKNLLKNLYE